MPHNIFTPPSILSQQFQTLESALGNEIPLQKENNLLIATWNIRMFGDMTKKWFVTEKDKPKRSIRDIHVISEIISRFDVVAVQEVMGNLRALRYLLKILGDDWDFLMTDVTRGDAGNRERLAYLYNRKRIRTSGLAAEIVIPNDWTNKKGISPISWDGQFARTPYAVSFRKNKSTFILVTAHIDYGKSSSDRIPELRAIGEWMAEWAKETNRFHHDLILLGDFNIDRKDDALWKAFTENGLHIPEDLQNIPRSVFLKKGNDPKLEKFYDQIAWFNEGGRKLQMNYIKGGSFDFMEHIYPGTDLSINAKSFRVSDHYPLWVEFEV